MYNISEVEYRMIERIEEEMLGKFFKTGKGCPIFQLYFKSGNLQDLQLKVFRKSLEWN